MSHELFDSGERGKDKNTYDIMRILALNYYIRIHIRTYIYTLELMRTNCNMYGVEGVLYCHRYSARKIHSEDAFPVSVINLPPHCCPPVWRKHLIQRVCRLAVHTVRSRSSTHSQPNVPCTPQNVHLLKSLEEQFNFDYSLVLLIHHIFFRTRSILPIYNHSPQI